MSTQEDPARLNGRLAARWARRTVERLRRERNDIDAINVFPVPDGDTGSNLYYTVRSAYRAVEELTGTVTLPEVIGAMATGALRGARGNSGLILSVALRGVADGLEGVTVLDAPTFASALELAAGRAREAVADPVDGTMLTVLDSMALEAREQADAGADLVHLIEAVRGRSQAALRETTGQLDVLFEADVVDAGSTGIVELFDLLYLTVTGQPQADSDSAPPAARERGGVAGMLQQLVHSTTGRQSAAQETGLELVFHLSEQRDRSRAVKRSLSRLGGTSIVVSWPMVHVHVDEEPRAAQILLDCSRYGIVDLRVEDLAMVGGRKARTTAIALASGAGLLLACALQDAHVIDSENPQAAARLDELIADAESPVLLLPDSGSALKRMRALASAAAEDSADGAADGSDEHQPVGVVRSRSLAGVLSALAVYDAEAEHSAVLADMTEAAAGTRVGSVVRASSASTGTPAYAAGDLLTVIDGRVRAVDADPGAAVSRLADRLLGAGGELLTVITGAGLPAEALARLSESVAQAHPDVLIQTVDSLHPHGCAVLGVE